MLDGIKRVSCLVYQNTLNSPELAIRTISSVILYEITKKSIEKISVFSQSFFKKINHKYFHQYYIIFKNKRFVCAECLSKQQKQIVKEMKNIISEKESNENKLDSVTSDGNDEITHEQIVDMLNKNS